MTEEGRTRVVLSEAGGLPVHCPTDFAVLDDGSVLVTDGSSKHFGQKWVCGLMERNSLGRLLRFEPGGTATVVADGLAYASGVALTEDGSAAVSPAGSHRISTISLTGQGQPTPPKRNLPGYRGRLEPAARGGLRLATFALRTEVVEVTATQRDDGRERMRTTEPDCWIRPALRSLNSGLEPLQRGQIRKLGVIKPWAPPRSYGLVVRLDADGHPA